MEFLNNRQKTSNLFHSALKVLHMKSQRVFAICLITSLIWTSVATRSSRDCKPLPQPLLEEILGPAFNGRYMSINKPQKHELLPKEFDRKRDSPDSEPSFAVDNTFMEQLHERPAWELRNHAAIETNNIAFVRDRRSVSYIEEWHCDSKVVWLDLGPDYFPRYLRSVECVSKNCWFHIYNCRPRSFTIKLLRKKRNKCVQTTPEHQIGILGLPRELAELWVWEERAVTFCCDCKL